MKNSLNSQNVPFTKRTRFKSSVSKRLLTTASVSWLTVWAVVIIGLAGCNRNSSTQEIDAQNPATAIVQAVEVIKVSPTENAYRSTTFFGTLTPRRNIPLAFTQGGRVASINPGNGETVSAGDVLARTDGGDLDAQKAALENSIREVRQRLDVNPNSTNLTQQINDLQRQLDEVNRTIANNEIVAPFDGVVTWRNVDVGQVVSAGLPVFDIVDLGVPVIEAQVATGIANQMTVGESVWVLVAGRPYQATVASVLPTTAGASRTRKVVLEFSNDVPSAPLNSGDAVEIRYWTQTNRFGFWLPYSALQQQASGLWSVLVIEYPDSGAVIGVRTLDVIQLQDDLALVNGALQPNERVVINGLNRVVPGQRVTVEPIENAIVPPGPVTADGESRESAVQGAVESDDQTPGANESEGLDPQAPISRAPISRGQKLTIDRRLQASFLPVESSS